ncbi:50S ribosomal protein L21 [Candidatus Woesebacteria bacterium]|nr:50S ribosomal protein L21 [Candidatus Woesebacteria bacterium]
MSYAIIQIAGKQIKVAKDDVIVIDRQENEQDSKIVVTDVLMVGEGDSAIIGTPLVSGAKVVLAVTEHGKGEKIRVAKYKSKSRYRKVRGHRQYQTTVTVESITA